MTLQPTCAAVDSGVILPNINDTFSGTAPDRGAHEYGGVVATYGPRPPPTSANDEVVLYAAESTTIVGDWQLVTDPSAATSRRLQNPNAGAAKLATPFVTPPSYFELTFNADAGKAYRLWIRGRAEADDWANDSAFVQFDHSVTESGTATYRIGTTSATTYSLENCSGCCVSGWGWQDNGYGAGMLGPAIVFDASGPQRVRIQVREDGLGIDQVVLSAVKYLTAPPGAMKNDMTILPRTGSGGSTNAAPAVSIISPAANTTFTAPASIDIVADARDSDGTVSRVEFFANGAAIGSRTAAPWSVTWSGVGAGSYSLTAVAADNLAATTTSAPVSVTVTPGSTTDEVVLYAADATTIAGQWRPIADATAAGGLRLQTPDAGAAKLTTPLATPASFFELTFNADAGKPYRLWVRGKAEADHWANDSAFVQFDHSVTESGTPTYRIGTTSATTYSVENCSGCGVSGWGWEDNGYGSGVIGPLIYFDASGPQRLRIQLREDGLGIDQVVLSSIKYVTSSPGVLKNDATILPRTGSGSGGTTIDEIVLHARTATIGADWIVTTDSTAAGGARLQNPNLDAAKVATPLASPAKYFELTFHADAGKAYRLWIRSKAESDSWANDSAFVQFDHSVTQSGTPTYRIGTTAATTYILEDCNGCGLSGWGWQDNGYGTGVLGPLIYFDASGPQRLRIHVREDGLGIDQIVLSAVKYLTSAPGAVKGDTTILAPR